jgi:hypothetical protein
MKRVILLAALLIPSQAAADDRHRATIGYATIGAGAAFIAAGTYFGAHAYSLKRDADCTGKLCSQRGLDDIDSARTSATLSTITFGVGIAALGVGTYLVLSAPKNAATTTGLFITPTSFSFAATF